MLAYSLKARETYVSQLDPLVSVVPTTHEERNRRVHTGSLVMRTGSGASAVSRFFLLPAAESGVSA